MAQAAVMDKAERGEQLRREGVIIRTWDLMKTYVMGDQTIHAVAGIDIEIKKGEYVAIMGPSGSGKSTMMSWRAFATRKSDSCSRPSICWRAPRRCTTWSFR